METRETNRVTLHDLQNQVPENLYDAVALNAARRAASRNGGELVVETNSQTGGTLHFNTVEASSVSTK